MFKQTIFGQTMSDRPILNQTQCLDPAAFPDPDIVGIGVVHSCKAGTNNYVGPTYSIYPGLYHDIRCQRRP